MLKKLKKARRKKLVAMALVSGVLIGGANYDIASATNNQKDHSIKTSQSESVSAVPQLNDAASIDAVVDEMTIEEKAKLVVGIGYGGTPNKVNGAAGMTQAITRLGIPSIVLADGPAGVRISPTRAGEERTYYATAFPIATSMASTWNTSLANKVGQAFGNEVKEYGVDLLLSPALNIHRNPLNGRNFEYYSEDPVVSGKMTAAIVNGVEANGVGTTIKHFAANNQETNRQTLDTIVSERALREIYLAGFEIAIKESQPWAVMSAYNKINGTFASEREDLLTDVLRGDWGFEGFVMTDWGGGSNVRAQMIAGNELLMPGNGSQTNEIIRLVNDKLLDETILDRNVKRILEIIVRTPSFNGYEFSNNPNLEENAQISRQAATEGMVLLKNESGTLPLNKNESIAVFGNSQIETIKGGTGSGDVNVEETVSIVDGLQTAGFTLHQELVDNYSTYISDLRATDQYKPTYGFFGKVIPPIPEKQIGLSEINAAVSETDTGMIVIGRTSGEFADRTNAKGDYLLTDQELEMITNVAEQYHAAGKKVAVVLNIGGPVEVESWRDKVDSILLSWQPGQEAGHAIADVLSGDVNPSGKLSTTFPLKYSDVGSAPYFPGTPEEGPEKVTYNEDIYVGYRYNTTFNVKTAYEFGYGLSYTTFDYSNVRVNKGGKFKDDITVLVNLKNTGKVSGKEAVQVYVSAPDGKLEKPELELKDFGKTKELKPNQSELLKFDLNARDIASYDEERNAWIVEKGIYEVKIGASSEDIKGTATFKVDKEIIVEEVSNSLEPKESFERLSKN